MQATEARWTGRAGVAEAARVVRGRASGSAGCVRRRRGMQMSSAFSRPDAGAMIPMPGAPTRSGDGRGSRRKDGLTTECGIFRRTTWKLAAGGAGGGRGGGVGGGGGEGEGGGGGGGGLAPFYQRALATRHNRRETAGGISQSRGVRQTSLFVESAGGSGRSCPAPALPSTRPAECAESTTWCRRGSACPSTGTAR